MLLHLYSILIMARLSRIIAPGLPHHVTQRGNRRQDIFFVDEDREAYLNYLRKYMGRYGLEIYAYCLMTNHVHLVAVPVAESSLSNVMRDTHTAYAGYRNRCDDLCGHIWQGRFFSTVLDEAHLWAAVRYVERNPVRAGMVENAADYPWSSAAAHCNGTPDPNLSTTFPPPGVVEDCSAWLMEENDIDTMHIRQQTRTGRPSGTPTFLESLENLLQRNVRPQKRGPKPRKNGDDE